MFCAMIKLLLVSTVVNAGLFCGMEKFNAHVLDNYMRRKNFTRYYGAQEIKLALGPTLAQRVQHSQSSRGESVIHPL